MTIATICRPVRSPWDDAMDRCFQIFPCLADPGRMSSLCLKLGLVMIHLIYAGVLFLFDGHLIEKIKKEPWYITLYLLLFVVTLIQYFATSLSSPGYVLEAMHSVNERSAANRKAPEISKNGSYVISTEGNLIARNGSGSYSSSWSKLVADLYPLSASMRTWTCTYCNVEQPPRAKHCHDCDKCVLQFDHHCVWLGNCIGQGNHCKFWWYLFEETALCLWTGVLYILYLKAHITRVWWQDAIMIILLMILLFCLAFLLILLLFDSYLILTNQTGYEFSRRSRIHYLRGIPDRVNPFSRGVCRNLYNFCCARSTMYGVEPLATSEEIEEKSRPYTCLDAVTCRCC